MQKDDPLHVDRAAHEPSLGSAARAERLEKFDGLDRTDYRALPVPSSFPFGTWAGPAWGKIYCL